MTKEKHPLLAVAAASLAVSLAACDQTTPAAGGPGPGAASGAPPAAAEPGLRTETLIVAIVADEDDDASLARRVADIEQHGQTINRQAQFPSDFTYEHPTGLHVYTHAVPWATITRDVLERGAIIPWASFDGGATWITSSFSFPFWNLQITAKVGEIHFVINGTAYAGSDRSAIERLVKEVTRDQPILVRLYVIKTTGTR